MNTRVLELIKNPKTITETDLGILESESAQMPYAQSIRALYLYGINLFKPESYKENLSKTAAYTTDKKILYQFINSDKIANKELASASFSKQENTDNQINEQPKTEYIKPADAELVAEIENTDNNSVLNKFDVDQIIEKEEILTEEFIVVNGEKNRLLYEGEENLLEEKTPEIDLEASKESRQLTLKEETESVEKLIVIDENPSAETIISSEIKEDINEEKNLDFSQISEPEPEIQSKDISFSGIQDFLPEVKFSVPKNHLDYLNPPKKEKKEESIIENLPVSDNQKKETFVEILPKEELEIEDVNAISFENTQAFDINPTEKVSENSESEILEEADEQLEVVKKENNESIEESESIESSNIESEPATEWKPMQFDSHIPDALIGKQPEQKIEIPKAPEILAKEETNLENETVIDNDKTENDEINVEENLTENQVSETERPVFNVSFFGNEVSKIEEKQKSQPEKPTEKAEQQTESNVGTFINTWQSWLKINRPKAEDNTAKAKEKIIDNFIENNPKISQLKEESNFIIKEKKDDISHLMTETLAKLYAEQKLYSKAIKAYEILSEKHPHKKDYFKEKIEEIKEIRKP